MEAIRQTTWEKAIELTKNIDEFDTPFVTLSLELGSPLWTGDKKLIKGLVLRQDKNFNFIRDLLSQLFVVSQS